MCCAWPAARRAAGGTARSVQGAAGGAAQRRELALGGGVCVEALENLDKDRAFLTAGDVFDDDQIDAYIELKMEEVLAFEMTPHPIEFQMYYSV